MAGRKLSGCTGDLVGYQVSFSPPFSFQYQVEAVCPNAVPVNTFSYSDKVVINSGQSPFLFQALTGETGADSFAITLSLGSRSKVLNINSNGEIN